MSLSTFYRRLKKFQSVSIVCPLCDETTSNVKSFYKIHALARHNLHFSKQCAFCIGAQHWDVPDYEHAVQCLNVFVEKHRVDASKVRRRRRDRFDENVDDSEPSFTAPFRRRRDQVDDDDSDDSGSELSSFEEENAALPVCESCKNFVSIPDQMLGRVRDRTSEYVQFYDPVFEKPELWISSTGGVEFDERSGLGKDVYGIFQKYLQGDWKWYHVMVKHDVFDTFVRELLPIRDEFVVLPFWCLCDGCTERRILHRHMIVACPPESRFRDVWVHKIRYDFPYSESGKSKKCHEIRNALHLAFTIQYVSQRKSSCDGKIPEDLTTAVYSGKRTSHFFMHRPLPEHGVAFLCTLFEGGVEGLLLRQCRNRDVVDWMDAANKTKNGGQSKKWRVPIRVLNWKCRNCVIPVAKRFEPTTTNVDESNEFCLHLFDDVKRYFESNPELTSLTRNEWYAHQVGKNNTFRSILGNMYVLSRKQQNAANQIKRMQHRVEKRKDLDWRSKWVENERRWEAKWAENERRWKAKWAEKERRWAEKERRWEAKWAELEKQRAELEKERAELRAELGVAHQTIFALRNEISKLEKDILMVELNHLRAENAKLKAENAKLKALLRAHIGNTRIEGLESRESRDIGD